MIVGVFRYHLAIRRGLTGPLWSSTSGAVTRWAEQELF